MVGAKGIVIRPGPFPAGKPELENPVTESLKIIGSSNVLLVNSRPSLNGKDAIMLHFRELEGKSADIALINTVKGRTVKTVSVVNAMGKKVESAANAIHFNPFEVKFIEIGF